MIGLPAGTRVWIAAGVTDLCREFTGLSGMVQTALKEKPFSGQVFVFRGRRGDLIKILWFDGDGLCLFAKRLERGRFIWPQATSRTVALTPAQFEVARRHRLEASGTQLRSANGGVKERFYFYFVIFWCILIKLCHSIGVRARVLGLV
jgi:transposase